VKKKVASSFLYTFLASILGFGFNFTIAKILGAKVYGEIVYYLSFIGLLGLIISMNYSSLYMGNKITKGDKKSFSLFLTIESILFLIVAIPAYFIILHYVQDVSKTILILFSGYMIVVVKLIALDYNANKDISSSILVGNLLPKLFLIIPFVFVISIGIKSSLYYLYFLLLSNLVIVLYAIYKFRLSVYFNTSIFSRAWKFYLLGIIGEGFRYFSQILQKEYGSYEALASLAIVMLFFAGLELIDSVLIKFVLPKVHEYFKNGDMNKIGEIYKNNTILSLMLNLPIFIWLIFNIDFIAKSMGKGYELLPYFFYVLSIGYSINMITGITGYLLRATENEKYEIYNEIARAIVGLTAIYALRDNQYGVAIAISISMLVYNLLKYGELYHLYKFKPIKIDRYSILYISVVLVLFFGSSKIDILWIKSIVDMFLMIGLYLMVLKYIKGNKDILKGYA